MVQATANARYRLGCLAAGFAALIAAATAPAQQALPAPLADPRAIDFNVDPVLRFVADGAANDDFGQRIAATVVRHPAQAEAAAGTDVARTQRREARALLFPALSLLVIGSRWLARDFVDSSAAVERLLPSSCCSISAPPVAASPGHQRGCAPPPLPRRRPRRRVNWRYWHRLSTRASSRVLTLDRARSALVQARASAAGGAEAVARARATVAEVRAAAAAVSDRWRAEASNDLVQARAELAGQQAGLPSLQRRVEQADVRSPVSGTVQRVLVGTVGSAAAPGAPLVEVVPKDGALAIAARVWPSDIGFVHIGQPAAVRITSYDSSVYGTLKGRATRISPHVVADERGGDGWYDVRIETSQRGLVRPAGRPAAIGSGIVAEVALLRAPRTLLSYLLSPVTRLCEDALRER